MIFRLLPLLSLCLVALPLQAEEGSRAYVEGSAWVVTADGIKRRVTSSHIIVAPSQRLVTGKGARAVIRNGEDTAVLGEESTLLVRGQRALEHIGGRIFYAFRKLFGKRSQQRQVVTAVATVGIRGTSFLIEGGDTQQSIAMAEGEVDVEAREGEFKHFEARPLSEFERYQRQMMRGMEQMQREFDQYRQDVELQFRAYQKSLTLGDGRMLSLNGNEAVEGEVTATAQTAIEELRGFLEQNVDQLTAE